LAARIRGRRHGAAAVEFALVVPIMLSVMMGIFESGRAFMVIDLVNDTARQGARVGAVADRSSSQITAAVDTALTNARLPSRASGTTLTIKVDNASVDASTAASDAQISVTVAIRVSSITWVPTKWFLNQNTLLSATVVMRRE
jgi:Flp pilus assembly protein TadG